MDKKTILVTGANGYIGRHVVSYLLDQGMEVLAADIRFDEVDPRAQQVTQPIFEPCENMFEAMGCPDVCVHLAWRNGFVHNSDTHIQDLPGHYQFLKSMMEGGLQQLVVMGSMHEVGYWEGAIQEDTPTNPLSLYGIAKNSLRQMVSVVAKQKNVTLQWIRGYYIVGDDIKSNSIFSKIVQAERDGKEKFPFTSGKNLYDFISLEGLTQQIGQVAMQREVDGIINCCTGKPMSLADRVEQFIKDNHFKITLDYGAFPDRPYDSPGVWGDATKINQILAASKER